ncbi:MAG: hypothetical protein J6A15_05520 [Clostridia bacterium]|nr:hypothetical protein [Clostridia bacterium]
MKINENFLEYIYYLKVLNCLYNNNLIEKDKLEKIKYNLLEILHLR